MSLDELTGDGSGDGELDRQDRAAAAQKFIDAVQYFRARHAEARKSHAVVVSLLRLGCRYAIPRSSTWSDALYVDHFGKMLFILFRRRGVDVRIFESSVGVAFDKEHKVRFSGGLLLRMDYADPRINFSIHRLVRDLVQCDFDNAKGQVTRIFQLLSSGTEAEVVRSDYWPPPERGASETTKVISHSAVLANPKLTREEILRDLTYILCAMAQDFTGEAKSEIGGLTRDLAHANAALANLAAILSSKLEGAFKSMRSNLGSGRVAAAQGLWECYELVRHEWKDD